MSRGRKRAVVESDSDDGEAAGEVEVKAEPAAGSSGGDEAHAGRGRGKGKGKARAGAEWETLTPAASSAEPPAGTILRIRLRNFLTYDRVDVRPGPHLNMVIGPNGTGKSSIVCAIALGLAAPPTALGRAKHIAEFVKHGADSARIELTLKGPPGADRDIVVSREFDASASSKSVWKVNGKTSTRDAVLATVKTCNIQITNLCQFLPQDRVSEFAQMQPQQLLRETSRAIDETLLTAQDELGTLQTSTRALQTSIESDRKDIQLLESRNEAIGRDVTRFRERAAILHNIKLLAYRIPWAKYSAVRFEYKAMDKQVADVQAAIKEIEDRNGPIVRQRDALAARIKEADAEKNEHEKACKAEYGVLEQLNIRLETRDNEQQQIRATITELNKRHAENQSKIAALRGEVDAISAEIERAERILVDAGIMDSETGTLQPTEAVAETPGTPLYLITEQLAHKTGKLREHTENRLARENESRAIERECARIRRDQETVQRQLQEINDVRNQKIQHMQRVNPDAYKAMQWIEHNRRMLEDTVHLPTFLEIKVKTPAYTPIVENVLGMGVLMTFFCRSRRDYDLLTSELNDKRKWRINVQCFNETTMAGFEAPVAPSQLRPMGFDGYVVDLIDAPEMILAYLCQTSGVHSIAYSKSEDINFDLADRSALKQYIAGTTRYSVKEAYGSVSRRANTIRENKLLSGSVDSEQLASLETRQNELFQELAAQETTMRQLSADVARIDKAAAKIERERSDLLAQRRQLDDSRRMYLALRNRRENRETQIEDLQAAADLESEERRLMAKMRQTVLEIGADVAEYMRRMQIQVAHFKRKQRAVIGETQLRIELKALEDAFVELQAQLEEKQAELATVLGERERRKQVTKEALRVAKAAAQLEPDEVNEATEKYPTDDVEELEAAKLSEEARADAISNVDPNVEREYNRRLQEIKDKTAALNANEAAFADAGARLAERLERWKAQILGYISRISEEFSRAFTEMGCAGEVRLDDSKPDISTWGVEILVKFRAAEKLQPLTGQRQSGGERAVSTILYLMALQALSSSPFRVVDEINQGMDPRNERLVHSLLVKAACEGAQPKQCFLITPKLLPNLQYHEKMKVLCIYSGVWLPPHSGFGFASWAGRVGR